MNKEKKNYISLVILNLGTSILCLTVAIYHLLVTHNKTWVIIEIILTFLNSIAAYINIKRLKNLDK